MGALDHGGVLDGLARVGGHLADASRASCATGDVLQRKDEAEKSGAGGSEE